MPSIITHLALIANFSALAPKSKVVAKPQSITRSETPELEPVSMDMTKSELLSAAADRAIVVAKSWNKSKLVEVING
jgi:hypothetical protein